MAKNVQIYSDGIRESSIKRWFMWAVAIFMLLAGNTMAQIKVNGKVSTENGEPLPGVSIIVKGSSNGINSDNQGNYSLEIPSKGAILVFSSIGFKSQEQNVGNRVIINVSLVEEENFLNEMVVIGYGQKKKSEIAGAVGSVGGDQVLSRGNVSVSESLQGSISGVDIQQTSTRPGGGFNINIRGVNSLNSGVKPLFVVDGIVTDNIDFLNPADIDRIDILKDASSTAIYGSRGSSGVVLISTKKADNASSGKLRVNYDSYIGFRQTAREPEFMDGRQFVDYRASAYMVFNKTTGKWSFANNDPGTLIMSHTDKKTGSPVWANRLYEEDYTDFAKLVQQNGLQQNHYVNMSGNTNGITYNFGVGYQNEKGNFVKEKFDRYNIKLSVTHKASKYIETGATVNLTQSNTSLGSGEVYVELFRMVPFFTPYNPDGSPVVQPGANGPANQTNRGMTGGRNPLAIMDAQTNEDRRSDVLGIAYLQVNPLKGLMLKSTISPRFNRTREGFFQDIVQDTYLQLPAAIGTRVGESSNRESFEYTWDNMVNYTQRFSNNHNLSLTGVYSVFNTRFEGLRVQATNLPFASEWYNLFSGDFVQSNSSSSFAQTGLLSYLGRADYDFRGKYLLTASVRRDGASRLSNKWATFPSVALAWNVAKESFMQFSWLTDLKLRASFGVSGSNAGVSPYSTITGPNTGSTIFYNFGNTVVKGFAPGNPVNVGLTWEKTNEVNFGADFSLLKGNISGSVDWYNKTSNGLLLSRNLAIESGVGSMTDNIGSVNNRGIELSLNTVNIDKKNFTWTTGLTLTRNKNKILSIYNSEDDDIGNRWFIGQPVEVIYDYEYLGVFTQADFDSKESVYTNYTAQPGEAKVADLNNDNRLDANDRKVLGTPFPNWFAGLNSNMKFKNWDLGINLVTRQGMLVEDQFSTTFMAYGGRSRNHIVHDYYVPAGTTVPDWDNFVFDANGYAIDLGYKTTTEEHIGKWPIDVNRGGAYFGNLGYYKETSFVKVKNISLGYTFNQNLLKPLGVNKVRLYGNVLNPLLFTNYIGFDPEYAETNINNGNGLGTITYQIGANIQF
ncbi:SusC/RagA family TonB-linked outer membrane protein [Lacihabitans sp. LS3-19]|uniref:SusC/RagA family TonB-linked outer membrane protein n=1 Tax=Lacihabitans sp. LS3-19 TaxID=2487335 RepID=UPI0020CF59FC|nr:SusC/RagA family TonB-linked outer membrane protein [Lacihabitans sp. LS3-19]MCP9770429.1 SusC/RagA family TonB-linked outer membrane protein [Lacihabitans sp. LS3-19]